MVVSSWATSGRGGEIVAKMTWEDNAKMLTIKKWVGLNESPDGDTGLKNGEASSMRNFRITRENHLQIRPGYGNVCTLSGSAPVRGLWSGYVDGKPHLLAACGGHLWDIDTTSWAKMDIGAIHDGKTSFFGFSKRLYILTGTEYYRWTGTGTVTTVEGYAPIVLTASAPDGTGGTLLERVNLLTGIKRMEFSPDGTATVFQLAEKSIDEFLGVEGTAITFTSDLATGKITFSSPPPKGTSTIRVKWRKGFGSRYKVTSMLFAELFNGASDSRVFLYGDGTNETIYSGLDDTGQPSAEYFPDMNVMAVDSANTPITSMIRHYDRLLIFKSNSAYSAQYSTVNLSGGAITAAFFASPLNREIGCTAPGQAKLVSNNPRTVFGRSIYEWVLAGGSSRDERNAKRISDRIEATLSTFVPEQVLTFDDEERREFYICCGDKAVVQNYANDSWYIYTHFPVAAMAEVGGDILFGTATGKLMHVSRKYRNDDTAPIDAYWESGSMDFGADWRKKYSSTVWASMKPESQALVLMTAQSNVKSDYPEKILSSGLSTMLHANFKHWSFGTNRKPQVIRLRLKVKKATYYKLILSSLSASATATILSVDIQVRYTGNVK